MIHKERRHRFLIDRPFQMRYMFTITLILLTVTLVSLVSLYSGIWGGVLDAFSDEKIRNDLLTASRIQQYEEARRPLSQPPESASLLSFFTQAERLSERQREVFKELLDQTNRNLIGKLVLLLLFIALGSIFLSHKIAGPLYRFQKALSQVRQGDLGVRCQLRKFDEAKEVARALNQTLEVLDGSLSRIKRAVREHEKDPASLLPFLKEELSKFKTSAER